MIGAEVFISFPAMYLSLNPSAVGTSAAVNDYQKLAEKCLIDGIISGEVKDFFGKTFFTKNPNDDPRGQPRSWRRPRSRCRPACRCW